MNDIFNKAIYILSHHPLEHNLSKNVSNAPAFLWHAQIEKIKNLFNDTIWIENKIHFHFYSFTRPAMNFQTILMPKVILAKILSQKNWFVATFNIWNIWLLVSSWHSTSNQYIRILLIFLELVDWSDLLCYTCPEVSRTSNKNTARHDNANATIKRKTRAI